MQLASSTRGLTLFIGGAISLLACASLAYPHPHPQAEPDSQRILKQARSAQRRFESERRLHLPFGWARSGNCDERIGRLCMWHDDDDEPPDQHLAEVEEDEKIVKARGRLIGHLEKAAASLPGDRWIAGQRVRYLVEDGRFGEAYAVALRCGPAGHWWCTALAGYALHAGGEFEAAEGAFANALAAMSMPQRCSWTDLSLFLKGELRDKYRNTPCEQRDSLERRFWWLADPLYLHPANDRLTEHLARRVQVALQEGSDSPFAIAWGSDLAEVVLRYGWPTRWEKAYRRSAQAIPHRAIIGHHPDDGRRFLPPAAFVEDPASIQPEDWPLADPRPRTEYAPAYASFETLDHQLALFKRGDSTIVVTAFDIDRDSLWSEGPVEAAVILAADELEAPAIARDVTEDVRGVFGVKIAGRPTLLSLELHSGEGARAARARYGIRPPTPPRIVLSVSDLLLLLDSDSLPSTLSEALPLARGSARVKSGERIGLYWELYGVSSRGETLVMSLTVTKKGKSWFKKLAQTIGVASSDRPMSLNWEEQVPGGLRESRRALSLELPEMSKGTYLLRLQVNAYGREPVVASRELIVKD